VDLLDPQVHAPEWTVPHPGLVVQLDRVVTAVTATNLSWNGSIPTGGNTGIGFNGRWTGSYSSPTSFNVNGVNCGGVTPTTTPPVTTRPPTTTTPPVTTRPPVTTTPPVTTPPVTTTPPCTTNCPAHVENPFSGATGYVNPNWKAKAMAETGGSRIANQPTAVWLDRIAAIAGSSSSMGLRAHMDAAVTQDAANGSTPLYAEFVIYDLPNRDCSALASNGELLIANNGLSRYKTEYIDPIASILSDPKYAAIRVVLVIEPDSLPNLLTNLSFAKCSEAQSTGAYIQGVQYALNKFHAISNVYNYIDAAHHAWLGWDSNFNPFVQQITTVANGTTSGKASVDGLITNTANTSATIEPYFNINTTVGGTSVRQSKWVHWNFYVDEQSYAQALRTAFIAQGFSSGLGMLIDTSRNGWGNCVQTPCATGTGTGTNRPTAASTSTVLDTFVNASRVDRRIHAGNWCNQSGAGLGFRPTAAPAAGLDAYVWIKPPGESDGSSTAIPNDEGKGFDRMCDPTYTGNSLNGNSLTGALPNSPLAGQWFSAQFQQLMANAYPAL